MYYRSSIRQSTVFQTRPTHLRIKTETDCYRESQADYEKSPLKKPLRTYRISQFQGLYNKKINSVSTIKRSPAQRSIFGELNLHNPKFKKQNFSSADLEHPLKQYFSSLNERVQKRNLKKYKTGVNEGSQRFIPKYLNSQPSNNEIEMSNECNKENQILYNLIDDIYKKIDKFKEVGYTEKKINQWIQKYCLQRRKYMTHLLMKASNKHKFSQTQQHYFYERDPQKVKEKLKLVTKKINGKQKPIDQYDLIQFSNHIEEILIQKNRLKILELRDSISEKLDECFIYNRQSNEQQFGKKLYPADLLNFVSDLEQIEQRQGSFNKISSFNREYFIDLGKTQKDIRSKIYELIKITENNQKSLPQKQLTSSAFLKLSKASECRPSQIPNIKILDVFDLQKL